MRDLNNCITKCSSKQERVKEKIKKYVLMGNGEERAGSSGVVTQDPTFEISVFGERIDLPASKSYKIAVNRRQHPFLKTEEYQSESKRLADTLGLSTYRLISVDADTYKHYQQYLQSGQMASYHKASQGC